MLQDGYYRNISFPSPRIFIIHGSTVSVKKIAQIGSPNAADTFTGPLTISKFGKTSKEIQEKTREAFYNIEFYLENIDFKKYGVLNPDYKSFVSMGLHQKVEVWKWISSEELKEYIESCDSALSPLCPHPIQPNNQGKIIWITGPPGSGKSATAHLLSQEANFVYYEADCFFEHTNPYIPKESSITNEQPPLKDVSKGRIEAAIKMEQYFSALTKGKLKIELGKEVYRSMAENIKSEKARIGGDWVVAQAVASKVLRDEIKKVLGPDLIFVFLDVSKDALGKRLRQRYGENSSLFDTIIKLANMYEVASFNEPNTIIISVDDSVSTKDVMKCIQQKIV